MATVKLNVGGTFFTTTMATIQGKYPLSLFARGVEYILESKETGGVSQYTTFIDRDPNVFRHVLNFMRDGKLFLPEDFTEHELLLREAEFYRVDALKEEVNKHKERQSEVLRVFADSYGIYRVEGRIATIEPTFLKHTNHMGTEDIDIGGLVISRNHIYPETASSGPGKSSRSGHLATKYCSIDIRDRGIDGVQHADINYPLNAHLSSHLFLKYGLKLKSHVFFIDTTDDKRYIEWVFARM